MGQTFIAQKAANYLELKLGSKVEVAKVDISFFKFIRLEEIYVEDHKTDTLAYIEAIHINLKKLHFSDSVLLEFSDVQIDQPTFYLKLYPEDTSSNLMLLLNKFETDTSSSTVNFWLKSEEVEINNGHFIWDDYQVDSIPFGMDFSHIEVNQINLKAEELHIHNDSINVKLDHFSGLEKCGFDLRQLSGDLIFSNKLTSLDHGEIITSHSHIYANLEYTYDSVSDYANFIDQVYMRYQVDSSSVNMVDIAYFAPELQGLDQIVSISGKERGPVSDMKLQNLNVRYGNHTVVSGRVFMTGLPNFEETSFTCKFDQLSTSYADLSGIYGYPFKEQNKLQLPNLIKNLGVVEYTGNFTGFYNDFVTYGTFQSDIGVLMTDIQIAPQPNGDLSYRGDLRSQKLNLGVLFGKPKLLGKTTLDVNVEGKNTQFHNMDLKVVGSANTFEFNNYTYNNIQVDGTVNNKTIAGFLKVNDENLEFVFDGEINLKNKLPKFIFHANLDKMHPRQLNYLNVDSSATVSTQMEFNFEGNSIDNILGRATLSKFSYTEDDAENVDLDQVDFLAFNVGKDKTLSLKSKNVDLQITGQFYFDELINSFTYLTYKWLPSFFSAPIEKPNTIENFELHMYAEGFSGFSKIFVPQVSFEQSLTVDLWYNSVQDSLVLIGSAPDLELFNKKIEDFSINSQIRADTFNLQSQGKKLFLTDSMYISNLDLNTRVSEDLIQTHFQWNNSQTQNDNLGDLHFDLKFKSPENFELLFGQSWVEVKDTLWVIEDSSFIKILDKEYAFNHFQLHQGSNGFTFNGAISEDPTKKLSIEIDSFNLSLLNPLIEPYNMETSGFLSGKTEIIDFYDNIKIFSHSTFDNLVFNKQPIGDGIIVSDWNREKKRFDIEVGFEEELLKTLSLNGSYYPFNRKDQLNISAVLDQFPVSIIEPFFSDYINNVKGSISGVALIEGSLLAPQFNGEFTLNELEANVIYLNQVLKINNEKLFIHPDLIGVDAITVTDSKGKRALINFSLFHENFTNINTDLAVTSIDLFQAFETSKEDNDYFYGDVILTPGSTLGMETDYDGNLNLTASIKSGPGTHVFIPFYDDDEITTRDYIYFETPSENDSTQIEIAKNKKVESGMDLDMSLELTPNAEIELIFDEFTADRIKARGNGQINLKINESGDFEIYGNYEITEGNYLFTFSKIISKNFKINPNSRITWNGSPYNGQADITASYKVRTTLYELGITAAYDTSELRKRVPVEVILVMKNNYMNPDISFSFKLPPKYDEIQSLLNNLDEGERNKEVFGLLILNKFMPITGGDVSDGSSALSTNSTEVLSNQLSNWLSKISNDFDVGVRYNPGDKISADEVEVALSTQLFNDRVLVETNFGISGTATNTTTKSNNFVGEFTLSYKINKKGNIVGKVFNRSNELNPVYQNVSPYTQGVGIAYTEPFNTWDNLGCVMANNFKTADNKRDCEAEYRQWEEDHKEENLAKIKKKVAKSRMKQEKRNKRRQKRNNQQNATKTQEANVEEEL